MSRSDSHPNDFDYNQVEGRGNAEQGQGGPREYGLRELSSRESSRDFSARDFPSSTYYHSSSPPSNPADRRPLSMHPLSSSAYSPFVSPRMFNPPQGIAVGSGDTWSSKPATFSAAPTNHKSTPSDVGLSGGQGQVASPQLQPSHSSLVLNHHRPSSSARGPPIPDLFPPSSVPHTSPSERDIRDSRELYPNFRLQQQQQQQQQHQHQQQQQPQQSSPAFPQPVPSPNSTTSTRSTLWWGELEPWMDEEYAKQVCNLMGWDPVNIKVPRPAPDPVTGQQANNPGYCFLTFPSQAHAASVLSQINNSNASSANLIMPNSSKPFSLNWASSVPSATTPVAPTVPSQVVAIPGAQNPQYPKEYSIFVGDLAPEVSNSDLVAVFRNPVLGLRSDREPRFIRPFLSCKSAKIMLDPVTGVSRGYGFVRFTDEADQQRALIEMHGLYCLSRPMRISPATAKFKPAPGMTGLEFGPMTYPAVVAPSVPAPAPEPQAQVTIALPLPSVTQAKSVSAPLAGSAACASGSSSSLGGTTVSNSGSAASISAPSMSTSSNASSATLASAPSEEVMKAAQFANGAVSNTTTVPANGTVPSISSAFVQQSQDQAMAQRYNIPEESWKHHAQARAILSNLIGPNGEQLTSSDPYNTTVFVGGLSPLISEETLKTFFAPFGDIHYVKVPVGKHCGFVQFVRKPDAEKAIEKMQGFPIGGSRIRLSWGRSQYKAAQAAAQAAQAAAFQAQYRDQAPAQSQPTITPEQALQLLEKFGLTNLFSNGGGDSNGVVNSGNERQGPPMYPENLDLHAYNYISNASYFPPGGGERASSADLASSMFSPFSPDPNYLVGMKALEQPAPVQSQTLPHPSKGFPQWFGSAQDEKATSASGKASPTTVNALRPSSAAQHFNSFLGDRTTPMPFQTARASSRQEAPIGRPDASRRSSQDQYSVPEHDHDIHDLNGTLASLDLDHHQNAWKTVDDVITP